VRRRIQPAQSFRSQPAATLKAMTHAEVVNAAVHSRATPMIVFERWLTVCLPRYSKLGQW
jgi:hypothetical protein